MRIFLFFGVLFLIGTGPSSAAEFAGASRIKEVTVFPRGADVTREARVTLDGGDHVVVLDDLPYGLRSNSIRVEGRSQAGVEIGGLDVKTIYVGRENASQRKALEDQILKAGDERRALDAVIQTAEAQKRLIANLAELPTRPIKGDGAALAGGADWGKIFSVIGGKMAEAQAVILETRVKQREIDEKIKDLKKKLAQTASRQERRTRLAIRVTAAAAGSAQFTIKYQIRGASWQPLYEARLVTGEGGGAAGLRLIRRARILQSSGEDWDNVKLRLSTTRPSQGTAAPVLNPVRIVFLPKPAPKVRPQQQSYGMGGAMSDEAERTAMKPATRVGGAGTLTRRVMRQKTANIIQAPFQAIYEIPGAQSIPNEGDAKQVQIDALEMKPELVVRSVPSHSATAYLYGKIKINPDVSLLGGQVALFRDGVFVGNGGLPLLSGGEDHELGFGVDDGVRIKYAVISKKKGESGILTKSRTDERKYKITVSNLHKIPVKIEVIERIPVSGHEDILIKPLSGATKPSRVDIDDKSGVQAWDMTLKPGKDQTVWFGYEISWPKDRKIREVAAGVR